MTSRRQFLVKGAKVALVFGALPLLNACSYLKPRTLPSEDDMRLLRQLSGEHGVDILYLASLAPSGHNTQPWNVTVRDPFLWVIGSERTRWLPAVDPTNRELLLSIGAFLENFVLAANHYGYGVDYQVVSRNPTDARLLELRLHNDSPIPYPIEAIKARRTVRSGYLNSVLKERDLAQLTQDLGEWHYFPPGSPQAHYLAEATIEANRAQAFRDDAQAELAEWIRWSNKDAEQFRNGLTAESMEISGFSGWYVKRFYDRASVMTEGFRRAGVDRVIAQARSGGGWFAIVSPDSEMTTLIETGRMFEKLFLRVRNRSVAIHPMTQVLEERPWNDQVASQLGIKGHIQFVLRVGYLDSYPDPVSVRMPVSMFTKGGQS